MQMEINIQNLPNTVVSRCIVENMETYTEDEIGNSYCSSPGQAELYEDGILIPGTTNYANYTVKKGDTLWKIANTYGTTVAKLKSVNNLTTNFVSVGQELLIPSA